MTTGDWGAWRQVGAAGIFSMTASMLAFVCSLATLLLALHTVRRLWPSRDGLLAGILGLIGLLDSTRLLREIGAGGEWQRVLRGGEELAICLLFLASALLVRSCSRDYYESRLSIRFYEANQRQKRQLGESVASAQPSSSGSSVSK